MPRQHSGQEVRLQQNNTPVPHIPRTRCSRGRRGPNDFLIAPLTLRMIPWLWLTLSLSLCWAGVVALFAVDVVGGYSDVQSDRFLNCSFRHRVHWNLDPDTYLRCTYKSRSGPINLDPSP